ncbi:MAG TPA: hypothetical protein VFX85_10180 [Solirubrobacterales bacterium]|nr:hypothetical protein [Solirubrobacterales bacterium]
MKRSTPSRGGLPKRLLAALGLGLALLALAPAGAAAQPDFRIDPYWGPTRPVPGGKALFHVEMKAVGTSPTDGSALTITVDLPAGTERNGDPAQRDSGNEGNWSCSGATTVTCTSPADMIPPGSFQGSAGGFYPLFFPVDIAPSVGPAGMATVTLSGAGIPVPQTVTSEVTFGPTPLGFGMVPRSQSADDFDGLATTAQPVRQAGTHPYELRVNFDMSKRLAEVTPPLPPRLNITNEGKLKTVETILPKGLVGNPEATPKCTAAEFIATRPGTDGIPNCPLESQVGIIDPVGQLFNGEYPFDFQFPMSIPVYNLEPPFGQAASFGFSIQGNRSYIYAATDPANGYAIKALTPYIPATVLNLDYRYIRFTMWGVPSDPRHFRYRPTFTPPGEPAGGHRPFLTTGFECAKPDTFKQRVESYDNPGVFTPYEGAASTPVQPTGCDDPRIRFEPEIKLQPTARDAGGPTGLKVNLVVPQREHRVADWKELYDESGSMHAIDTPPMKKAVVTFPEGMTISTSAAQGLGNCAPHQIGLGTNDPVTCPLDSQYGTLTLKTPILPPDEPMVGRIYVAKQNDNPFNNFLSLYMVVEDVERGLLVKLPAKVELDPVTGQIKTTFDDLPQFPVSDMQLAFKGGVRAALVNPTTCGTKTIRAEFFSYAQPETPIVRDSNYEITRKADGSPCVNSLGERPFRPQVEAGTVSNSAGSYSPFVYRVQRSDDDQEFSQLDVNLPKGLLANISGVTKCSDGAIAAASGRTGTDEANSPSCPASSQIGTSDVGSGVGQVITYIPGKAYLAGPYRGAPLSMVVITPILAGPYDLGVIAVRSKIEVNPDTTQASVSTDPFPQIFKGIPVRIRDIRVKVDRQNTIINPTSCNPMSIGSRLTGTGGDVNTTADDTAATLSSRYQASNCENLPFKPQLSFKLKGGTNRGDYPALTATLKGRVGDANIAKSVVTLPHSEFLAQEHIRTVCTRVQFAAKNCPDASIYGHASAKSPLFDQTLEGPVYLRSSSNPLPDLVATLNGDINVVLVGRIDSVKEQIRNTFDVVPDTPVTQFTLQMQGGKKGLLVNSRNLCKAPARADVKMVGQNGKRANSKPLVIAERCKKKPKKAKGKKPKGAKS